MMLHLLRASRAGIRGRVTCRFPVTPAGRFRAATACGAAGSLLWGAKCALQARRPLCCEEAAQAPLVQATHDEVPQARSRSEGAFRRLCRRLWRWFRVSTRCLEFVLRAIPLMAVVPLCWLCWERGGERWMWRLILAALQAEGPIAVKFAQWASTRPDLLPRSVCDQFAALQAAVRPHSFKDTKRCLTEAFGPGWESALELDETPLGSGCMAQVHRGRLLGPPLRVPTSTGSRSEDATAAEPQEVAVKVRHPGAQEKVDLDLEVMWTLVGILEALVPSARYLAMSEAVAHFESFVRPQADMRIEADNLEAFSRNFPYRSTGRGLRVIFPQVLRPYVTESLLVESFEDATPLQDLLGQAKRTGEVACARRLPEEPAHVAELRDEVGGLCMDAFLKMLFKDNFVHGDMHPGNIMFRYKESAGREGPELVVLDAGLAVQMSPKDRQNFIEVFHVERSPGNRSFVRDEEGFVAGVNELVSRVWGSGIALGKVKLGDIFGRMLGLACEHRVKLETSFVTVATSIIVLEGVGRQLNPIVDLAAAARPLLAEAVKNRIWQH
eukprot:TRINITY_DN10794_c0_g2_i1.p1 TRINITY_DN10794_c0_g2~~TRINITY_DN10794_c0_g2_i1.p1  ORF type:complete len:554 (-),score=91.93 TRINITY_DN10794_c0_g2_i1:41-1702(-)